MVARWLGGMSACTILIFTPEARAGMPSVTWSDLPTYFTPSEFTEARLQAISFFLLVVLVCAWLVQRLWNLLARDFVRLPRLSYLGGLSLVVLWGLLFVLVLTMISGARELMTPGAWEKKGFTYQLVRDEAAADRLDADRYESLKALKVALWRYAEAHDGQFPRDRDEADIPADAWRVPGPSAMRYVYVTGRRAANTARPLAYEPGLFGTQRLVLTVNGDIERLSIDELQRRLEKVGP